MNRSNSIVTFQYNKSLLFVLLQWDNFWLSKCHIWPPKFKDQVTAALALVAVWDHILTPMISSPRSDNIVTRFSPPVRYFYPLTISNGKSFCSQISLNFNMHIYNKKLFYIFYDFLQNFVHHRLLIQSINISTKTLSFNSKDGSENIVSQLCANQ